MRIVKIMILVLIAIFALTFSWLNKELVEVNYYIGLLSIPLSFVMVISFAIGSLITLLYASSIWLKAKRRTRKLEKELKAKDKILSELQNIPKQDGH